MPNRDAFRSILRVSRTPVCLALALLLAGCGTRTISTQVYEKESVTILLRHELENGTRVEREFQHPAAVSSQRLSHILGALDVESSDGKADKARERRVAILPELIQPIAKGLAAALDKADSTQEIAVMAVRKQRRLGLFHKKFLTSFVAYIKDERLFIHLSRVDWEIPKEREGDKLPEPRTDGKQMPFRAVPGRKMTQAGSQGLAIRWRDPLFSAPVRVVSTVGGDEQRRTILMESTIPRSELVVDEPGVGVEGLDPDTLRALADLEEARRAGHFTETEYQQRRESLLGETRN